MYLSEPLSGVCLREDLKRKSGYKEANPSVRGGDGVKQSFEERKTENIRTGITGSSLKYLFPGGKGRARRGRDRKGATYYGSRLQEIQSENNRAQGKQQQPVLCVWKCCSPGGTSSKENDGSAAEAAQTDEPAGGEEQTPRNEHQPCVRSISRGGGSVCCSGMHGIFKPSVRSCQQV